MLEPMTETWEGALPTARIGTNTNPDAFFYLGAFERPSRQAEFRSRIEAPDKAPADYPTADELVLAGGGVSIEAKEFARWNHKAGDEQAITIDDPYNTDELDVMMGSRSGISPKDFTDTNPIVFNHKGLYVGRVKDYKSRVGEVRFTNITFALAARPGEQREIVFAHENTHLNTKAFAAVLGNRDAKQNARMYGSADAKALADKVTAVHTYVNNQFDARMGTGTGPLSRWKTDRASDLGRTWKRTQRAWELYENNQKRFERRADRYASH
jgi:hypothetical protein